VLLILQFGYLGLSALFISVILWIFGITHGVISFSPIFIGIMTFLLVLVFLLPSLLGWRHEKRWRELLLVKRQTWIDELLDIFEFPTPPLYAIKLEQILAKAGNDRIICNKAQTEGGNIYSNREYSIDNFRYVYDNAMHQVNPCISYKNFLEKFKENIQECLNLLKSHGDDEAEQIKIVRSYAEVYRSRKAEIVKMLEVERTAKPILWIILAFVLTPILTTIISLIAAEIGPKVINLLPLTGGAAP
jgi:hypothetical protein